MTAHLSQSRVVAADTDNNHPHWCTSCYSFENGPNVAPTLSHGSTAQSWQVDDCTLELQLVQIDDPLDPDGPVGQPHVELMVTAENPAGRHGDVLFTMAQTADLVHRLQSLLDDVAREGRRTA
jgi:hypothetical protein